MVCEWEMAERLGLRLRVWLLARLRAMVGGHGGVCSSFAASKS